MIAKVISSFKLEYLFNKFKNSIANDKFVYVLVNDYNFDKDSAIILTNRIRDYQIKNFGDLITYDNEYKTREELDHLRVNANTRKYRHLRRIK